MFWKLLFAGVFGFFTYLSGKNTYDFTLINFAGDGSFASWFSMIGLGVATFLLAVVTYSLLTLKVNESTIDNDHDWSYSSYSVFGKRR